MNYKECHLVVLLKINTNGILTLNVEFSDFINQPFPLEYPSIAPFYSNVDTTDANWSSNISIFESVDGDQLQKATDLVHYAFNDHEAFHADRLIVGTWQNVGYFDRKTDKLNTFQVAIIANNEETFVQFIYPAGGLNWLHAETGDLGLQDIRAQAGFISEDGRVFHLTGSGTDNARHLNEDSNVGVPGVWVYRVGSLTYTENVQDPTNTDTITELPIHETCADGNYRFCHSNALCVDKSVGFCCVCKNGFYGNGHSCIKNDYPIRVTGTLSGQINGETIDERSKLQSYVVMADARSYTAINPISSELGANMRLVLPIVSTIGWLFAKPVNDAVNGYQLTGGEYFHSSKLQFESGEVLFVNQTFEGLNYWDQLAVRIVIHGGVPKINHRATLHMADYIDEYRFVSPNELRSVYAHTLEVPEENRVINYQLEQTIQFDSCLLDTDVDPTDTNVLQKVSKIVLGYNERDQALRTSVLTKIGVDAESNACTDGSVECGENTVCVPYEDTYRCDCLHGYSPAVNDNGLESCVDIDECALNIHVCDENAFCSNTDGGFLCVCLEGYEGNGYKCLVNGTSDNSENSTPVNMETREPTHNEHGVYSNERQQNENHQDERQPEERQPEERQPEEMQPEERQPEERQPEERQPEEMHPEHSHTDECNRCSINADCVEGHCECRYGFSGDGFVCGNNCAHDYVWENGRCVPILYDTHDIEPQCNFMGDCNCPPNYELIEEQQVCRFSNYALPDMKSDELVPCDVDSNCHANATCEWYEHELRHVCTCNPGFNGDGYRCDILDDSCATNHDLCDPHAVCNYNEDIERSECQCQRGYEGDGFRCQLAPECAEDFDCGQNSYCDGGVCQCTTGFERDISDFCVPAGRCGSVFCGANAICKWDAVKSIQYCDCMEGYEGDALQGCKSIPIPCNVRNNCGVHATCVPTEDPARYECQCIAGYHGDGYVCIEEQNCLNTPHMCDMNAKCLSTNTGLICVCNQGFYGNGSVCLERQQHDSGFLLVSQGVVIVRVPLNGKNVRPISVASMAIGLDKDCVEGRVYWGDISAKKIVSAKYDGTDMRSFITEDVESPEGIAIDSISRRIYWTDSVKDTIEVASLEDPTLRAVIVSKNLVNPRGIAVDPFREKLYWSDWNRESPKIEMSDLDGTGRELVLGKDSVTLPNSLVVLENTGELCFADAGTKKVECIDAYSKQLRTISNELTYPFGLSFMHDQFYWTDWTTKKLESVDSLGKRQKGMQTPFFGSHKMYGMAAVDNNCPQQSSPCQINNGNCADARICLSNRKAPSGKSCKCTSLSKTCTAPQFGIQY
ncbi:nidogen-like [Teleopsis dalmanni]|uniref:nidogen-like n=1 Tax=Teleopsis dalmanni TaxID=139649 RepID=UPI0018CDE23D|nr:nidogen-like [Teleopsis dalmanni]